MTIDDSGQIKQHDLKQYYDQKITFLGDFETLLT